MVNHARLLVVQIRIGDLRWRQMNGDLFAGYGHVLRLEPLQINACLHDAVREQQHAVLAIPFRVFKHDDLFEDVFDRNQIRQCLNLLDDRRGIFLMQTRT